MSRHHTERREFLKQMTALGAAVAPLGAVLRSRLAHPRAAPERAAGDMPSHPAATFVLKVSGMEFRRTAGGRQLMARIYQPQGAGPFPTVLDLHGGAWRHKDRLALIGPAGARLSPGQVPT